MPTHQTSSSEVKRPLVRSLGAQLPYIAYVAVVAIFLIGSTGCVHDSTIGPLFAEAPAPDAKTARVYLYRIDPHHSYSMVEIELDHERTIQLLDEEYVDLDLDEGEHEFEFRLRRRFGFPGSRQQKQRIRVKGGETTYLEIAVSVTDRGTVSANSREGDIAGRNPSGSAGEVVSMRVKDAREASERIRMTHLHMP